MCDLSIQIVNYKTKSYTDSCISDVLQDLSGTDITFEILVLDNNSGDDLSRLESKYKDDPVKFFYAEKNNGFGTGHNSLAEKGEGKNILILNPDISFIEDNTIRRVLDNLTNEIKVVGPRLLNEEGKQQLWDHAKWDGFWEKIAQHAGAGIWKRRSNKTEVGWVSGAFFLITRQVFTKIGGFDEKFFLYKEEEDLCLRVRREGHKVLYDPTVSVVHYGSVVASKDIFFEESDKYFKEKHYKNKWYYQIASFIYTRIIRRYMM